MAGRTHTGRIIITAAGFGSGQIVTAKTIGIGMIVALVIDASLVGSCSRPP